MNHKRIGQATATPEDPRPTRIEEARCEQPEQVFRAELLRFVADYLQEHSELELSMATKSLKCLSSLVTLVSPDVDTCCSHMNAFVNPGTESFFYSLAKSNDNNYGRDTFFDSYEKWLTQQGLTTGNGDRNRP